LGFQLCIGKHTGAYDLNMTISVFFPSKYRDFMHFFFPNKFIYTTCMTFFLGHQMTKFHPREKTPISSGVVNFA
jgi:hypothetical protein